MRQLKTSFLPKFLLGMILLLALILQDALPHWQLAGLRPNLPLCYAAVACLFLSPAAATFCGGIIGLLQDLLLGHYLGLHFLSLAIPAYGVAWGCRLVFHMRLPVAWAAVALFSLLSSLISGLLGLLYGLSNPFGNFLGEFLANLLLAPLAYWLVRRLLHSTTTAAADPEP